jgi:hypothetical protein
MDCLRFHFAAATELARIAISLIHVLDPYRAVQRDNTGSLPESYRADGVAHLHQMQSCKASGQQPRNITFGGSEGARVGVGGSS